MGPLSLDALEAAWRRSDGIFALLRPEAMRERPIPLRHPFVFYLGHLPAFAWNQICAGVLRRPALHGRFEKLFERGIDPLDRVDSAAEWPGIEAILEYRRRVRDEVRASLGALEALQADDDLAAGGRILHVVVEHERMHHETLLYMIQALDHALKIRPAGHPRLEGGLGADQERICIPSGRVRLGTEPSAPFGWDNEHPAHWRDVPAFEVDRVPVSNASFLRFVEEGGYGRNELWDAADLEWRDREGIRHPMQWTRQGGAWRVRTLFEDVPLETARDWPVWTSLAEARACARWRGARLPTEEEIGRAARGSDSAPCPPGNRGFSRWSPSPAGTHPGDGGPLGVLDLAGNGWEWTDSPFVPFDGFRAGVRTYPGYSRDFFDGRHFVLLGASWATDESLVRPGFRNWFQARYPWVFAKFRLARSV